MSVDGAHIYYVCTELNARTPCDDAHPIFAGPPPVADDWSMLCQALIHLLRSPWQCTGPCHWQENALGAKPLPLYSTMLATGGQWCHSWH
jgi:hypothetical protein